jgi:hypothetical protein
LKPKTILWITAAVVLAVVFAFAAAWTFQSGFSASNAGAPRSDTVPVDELVAHPDRFTDVIEVAGTVTKVDPASGAFAVGCEDVCVAMPVKFSGVLPAVGNDVIVRGRVERVDQQRYVFAAHAVEVK